jgi:hypothetical protein
MAQLSKTDRDRIWKGLIDWWNKQREAPTFSKQELSETIDLCDVWFDTNRPTMLAAMGVGFRGKATSSEVDVVLGAVLIARHDPELLRTMFGVEID